MCVNPKHLFIGHQKENMADCSAKGRTSRGSRHGLAKIDENVVIDIRGRSTGRRGEQREFAKEYGISRELVGRIIRRKCWKHV
jgi:hypothetical protein